MKNQFRILYHFRYFYIQYNYSLTQPKPICSKIIGNSMDSYTRNKYILIIYNLHRMQPIQDTPEHLQAFNAVPELTKLPVQSPCDIYRVKFGDQSFIAKVFPLEKLDNYERQKAILTQLNHPHIIKPIDYSHAYVAKVANTVLNAVILFPEYPKGDLFGYITKNGPLSEKVTLYFTRQIIKALSYAHENNILHPNLLLQNLLVDESRRVLLCGWSNLLNHQKIHLKDIFFVLGERIINMLSFKSVFRSRESKTDTYAKFLTEQLIHKLWEQLEKTIKKTVKNFAFSDNLKELLQDCFLQKIDSFERILESKWMQQVVDEAEVIEQLKNQQNLAAAAAQLRSKKIRAIQSQERQMVRNNFGVTRQSSRYTDNFQEQYEIAEAQFKTSPNHFFIQPKSQSDSHTYFQIFDSNLLLIVSHLRTKFKQAQEDSQDLIDPLLLLKDIQVSVHSSRIKMNFNFGWNYKEMQSNQILSSFNHSVELVLRKDGEKLLGRLQLNEAIELNSLCVYQLNNLITQIIQHYE